MVEPLENETRKQLEKEREKLQNERKGISDKLNEYGSLVRDLEKRRYEIDRRIHTIEELFEEFKRDDR